MTRLLLAFTTLCAAALCALQASRGHLRAVSSGPGEPLLMATARMARAPTQRAQRAHCPRPAQRSRQRQ